MGTGIVNTLLFNVPYASVHPALRAVGTSFLLFDIILFLAFSAILLARYSLHPAFIRLTLQNESHSLFLGTIPMGLVTIMSGIARNGNEYGLSRWTLELGLVGWWIAGVLSVFTAFGVPCQSRTPSSRDATTDGVRADIMFTRHSHTASTLTAAFLLPIVPPITIAAVGSSLATLLIADNRVDYAFIVLIVSYLMLGIGLGLAIGVLIIYGQRLALQRQPSHEVIVSTFLPLGKSLFPPQMRKLSQTASYLTQDHAVKEDSLSSSSDVSHSSSFRCSLNCIRNEKTSNFSNRSESYSTEREC